MSSVNPLFAAKHIAGLLDGDPVMARLVKEYVSPERLREVLELPQRDTSTLEKIYSNPANFTKTEMQDAINDFFESDS